MSVIQQLKKDMGLLSASSDSSGSERILERVDSSDGIPNVEASWHIALDDLELGECLGAGNYGQVFTGSYLGTDVAIKKMDVQAFGRDNMAKYIQRELACSKYSHPNIVGFIGVAEEVDAKYIYLVTELLQCSLREVLKTQEDLTWPIRISFANDTAKALAFLHGRGIIHRDIKSKNLLVDENMKVKICDFGFARTGSLQKRKLTICGTEEWMAPEVILGEEYNNAADVFSFGIVLLEIITSQKVKVAFPRSPQNFFSLDKEAARKLKPSECPDALMDLALSCCADEPEDRPTFRDIIRKLNQIRGELQLPDLQKTPKRRRSSSKKRLEESAVPSSPATSRKVVVRCSFAELNELALQFHNEIEIEEKLMTLFDSTSTGSWIVVGYYDENTLGIQASGTGGLEEMVDVLANDEVQYCLVRVSAEKDGLESHRDIFIFWSGPKVPIVLRGKKKTHLNAMQKILRPFHADLLAYNLELLTEDVVRDRSDPLSGSHVIE